MAYAVKYILQFTSDRGNQIRIEVLKKDYQGEVIYKSLGGSPSLSIEQGDGAIKGSSLVFAMQADIEGELQELYTIDNKQFKVNMYRNEVLTWQGYILPELYSEEYVDAPYDVSVTATDQLATLKAITYQREDVNVSISTMIEDILSFTQVSLPVTYHQNLSALRKGEVPMLVDSHISQAAYNGYSCYDVLTNILLSCNCCIMQINGEWLITSLTNSTTNYYTAGVTQVREHKALGQLGVGEVCPAGTLTMVNNPALKGAKVEYAHMLRHSFLVNADCVDREGWNYTPDSRNPIDIPGEREAFGKIFKTYCWELHPVNIREDNSLQLWQEVALEKDERNYYDLSVKTLFSTDAKLLLMAVTYLGSDGIERRLTAEGWVEKWDKSDVNYYIQITGKEKNAGLDAIADIEQYEVSTVQFALPPVDGTMRIGFINSTTDYTDPLASAPIYVSQVYLTVSGVTGQECTTEVEPNATQEQQGVLLAYGDTFESENAYKLGLNTLKKSSGENITSWWLDNVNFTSYYETMLQEFSRYFGVKKAQLQGIIMGKDVLSNIYTDVFSGRVMRLLTAQVDLLADEASVTVEEIVTTSVDFDTVIYATNNTNSFGSSSGGGGGTSGGSSSTAGESLLGVQSDGDVYVKDGRALVGQEGRFENLALPVDAPTERKEAKTYLYSSDPSKGAIDIAKIAKWIDEQEQLWFIDEDGNVHTTHNIVVEGGGAFGMGAESGGSTGGLGSVTIKTEGGIEYKSDASGVVTVPNWITASAIPSALKNPYALTFGSKTYDGSVAKTIVASDLGALTAHQSIYALTINNSAGIAQVTYTPNSNAASLTLTKAMVGLGNVDNTADSAKSVKYATTAGSAPASDVYSWAKAATKPSYTFSEITNKPTTLYGYGFTDSLHFQETNAEYAPARFFSATMASKAANKYIEWWQSGAGWFNHLAGKYIVVGANSSQFLKGDGSLDSTAYLPLSGGVVKGVSPYHQYIIEIDTDNEYYSIYGIKNKGVRKGTLLWTKDSKHLVGVSIVNNTTGDYLGLSDGGKIVLNPTGNVLIGTTTDNTTGKLQVAGQVASYNSNADAGFRAIGSSYSLFFGIGSGNVNRGIYDNTNAGWWIYRDATTNTYIPNGNVIIGSTTDDGYKLQVYGATFITGDADHGILIGAGSNTIDAWRVNGNSTSLFLNWQSSGHIVMGIGGGNTLIGTDINEGYKLDVNGSMQLRAGNYITNRATLILNSNSGNAADIIFKANSTTKGNYGWWAISSRNDSTGRFSIFRGGENGANSSEAEVFTIDAYGNLAVKGGGAFGSDIRYKDITSYRQIDLETIANAPLFTFRWTDREDKEQHLGTSAQYWLDTQFKDAVNTANKDFFHLDYGALAVGIGISVGREVKGVKTEVEQLRNKVKDLETRLSKYEQVWHN